jgi:ERCC4-type nuclease
MQIVVDVHERRSGVPDALRDLGWEVQIKVLPTGDYAIDDLALIERKTVPELHLSLVRGRLWAEAVRGLLITVDELGVTVIHAWDASDAAGWIARVAVRRPGGVRNVDRPPYAQRAQRDANNPPPERALAAATGVSTVTARKLLQEFGSLRNVLLAEPHELQRVKGVGVNRALAIHQLATSTSDSGFSRNCRTLST